jgi:hypothetical protein
MGHPVYRSSSLYFAPDDARTAMERASENALIFISAFYAVCKKIKKQFGTKTAPSVPVINRLLELHRIGYVIEPPNLVFRDQIEVAPRIDRAVIRGLHGQGSGDRGDLLQRGRQE